MNEIIDYVFQKEMSFFMGPTFEARPGPRKSQDRPWSHAYPLSMMQVYEHAWRMLDTEELIKALKC